MNVQTISQRNRTSRPGRGFDRRNAVLGTLCLLVNVALSVALHALLRTVTGDNWFFASLAAAFLVVTLLYGRLEAWFGLEPAPQPARPPRAERRERRNPAGQELDSAASF